MTSSVRNTHAIQTRCPRLVTSSVRNTHAFQTPCPRLVTPRHPLIDLITLPVIVFVRAASLGRQCQLTLPCHTALTAYSIFSSACFSTMSLGGQTRPWKLRSNLRHHPAGWTRVLLPRGPDTDGPRGKRGKNWCLKPPGGKSTKACLPGKFSLAASAAKNSSSAIQRVLTYPLRLITLGGPCRQIVIWRRPSSPCPPPDVGQRASRQSAVPHVQVFSPPSVNDVTTVLCWAGETKREAFPTLSAPLEIRCWSRRPSYWRSIKRFLIRCSVFMWPWNNVDKV